MSMQTKNLLFISIFSVLFFLAIAQTVFSTTIYVTPAMIIVYANDYPNTTNTVSYYLTLKNVNEFPVNVTLTKSGEITGLVNIPETTFVMQPDETRNVEVVISLNGPAYASGFITVNFDAADQVPVYYDVGVGINGRAMPPGQQCSGTITSCGFYPDCQDLTKLSGCYSGYYRSYYCSSNQPQYTSTCTNYCCQQFFGSQGFCQDGVCRGPSQQLKNIKMNITNGINEARSALVSLYLPGTNTIVNSTTVTGLGEISSTNSTVDFKLEYDSSKLTVLLKNLNLNGIPSTSNIILDSISPSISNVTLRRAFKISVPSEFSFTGIILNIKYSDLSVNEDILYLFRCGNFNLISNICNENWVKISMTKDTVNDVVTAELTSFSAYALGEQQSTTTTTVPSTTTTVPSNQPNTGGNSGGSSSGGSPSGGAGSPGTTSTTTTVPETATITTQTNQTQQQNQSNTQPLTGFTPLTSGNLSWLVVLPIAAVAAFFAWKFYFKEKYESPRYTYRFKRFTSKKRKHFSKETKLVLS